MRIHIIAPALPPQQNGIGDYSACLAQALASRVDVKLLTDDALPCAPLAGVAIEQPFTALDWTSYGGLRRALEAARPDWVLLQYNPFSYGRWGFNPYLPLLLRRLKGRHPGVRIAVMVHEPFVPASDWKFALMATWQRGQHRALGRLADVVFYSIEPWVDRFKTWFPDKPVLHLPVGSNVPLHAVARDEARRRLGLSDAAPVLGIFGAAHSSRLLSWVGEAARRLLPRFPGLRVLYVGPYGEACREGLGDVPLLDAGYRSPDEVSACFAAMDVYLAPFIDGASSRRTSLVTALQHGVPTVSTEGELTDRSLRREQGHAFLLAPVGSPDTFAGMVEQLAADPARRLELGAGGRELFLRSFTWERITARLLDAVQRAGNA